MANLPVPTLASELANNSFTAALARAGIYNTGQFLLNVPLFVGTQTTSQSIGNAVSTWTALSLNTSQVDTYGGHSNVTNNTRYTAQVPGYYSVCGVTCWSANGTGTRGSRLQINGAVIQGTAQMVTPSSTNITGVATPLRTLYLGVGDYVELAGWNSSGLASPGLATGVASDLSSALYVAWTHA
jgi:hypothetical protein